MTSKSFTITSPYKLPAIVTSGNVRRPYNVANPPSVLPAKVELNCLWDTGAVMSMLSNKIIAKLGLCPVSKCTTYHAHGSAEAFMFSFRIANGDSINFSE